MANDNGRIYIDTESSPNVGISIGDLQDVFGTVKNDIGQIVTDTDIDIKPMAKYKPVRHPSLATLTNSQRASVRYGFDGNLPQLTMSQNEPQNDWVYLRPRGKGQGSGGADEWFRFMDFNGYSSGACHPLVVSVGQLVYDGQSQLLLFGNEKSNAIREDGKTWVADQSLSLDELLESASDYYAHHISFLLIDTYDYAKNLIVMRRTMSEFVSGDYSAYVFPIYAETTTESGITYPSVPLLASSRSGHTFKIIVCLMAGNAPSSQDPECYFVYTASTNPQVQALVPYSLGFVAGSDRTTIDLASGAFKMDGTTFTVNVSYTDMVTELEWNGYTYHAFKVSVHAVFDTTQAGAYSGREMMVSGTLTLSNSMAFPFGPSPSEGDNPIYPGVAASLASRQSGQDKLMYTSGSEDYLWVMKNQGSLISTTINASITIDYPLDNPYTASGSGTIS